jgi:hypothetical protein
VRTDGQNAKRAFRRLGHKQAPIPRFRRA